MSKTINSAFYFGFLFVAVGCCSTFPKFPGCSEPLEDFRFTPVSITRLCPTHIGGDKEFDGHGPKVTARAALEKSSDDSEIWVTLYLHAKETKKDWTEAEGNWKRKLWTVPAGKKIVSIESDATSEVNYIDTNHSLDKPSVQGGNLVESFEIMGDTGNNDIGNCTSDDVYMNVYFSQIYGKMKSE